jgi:hypothetical protein
MTHYSQFDLLSVKILHTLFTYFLAHEILFSFSGVSDHVDTILLSYFAHRLDLKSIRRADFDFLLHRIRPEQVISLTLSDDNDTPGQTELFLSRFRIEQFTHLRSLTLINIEFISLEAIFSNMDKLKQLKVLSFTDYTITQLNRLDFSDGTNLTKIPLTNLRYLKLERCFIDDLRVIFQHAPGLKSLDICLNLEKPNLEMNLTTTRLSRLKLEIRGEVKIELFLNKVLLVSEHRK